MKRKLLCLLLGALMLFSCACGRPADEPIDSTELPSVEAEQPTEADTEEPAPKLVNVVEDGRSSFAIVVDGSDSANIVFGMHLQSMIYEKTGVMIPTRALGYAEQYKNKILIGGEAYDETVGALAEQTEVGRFSCAVSENTVVLYADDVTGYLQLEDYVSNVMLAEAGRTWTLTTGSQIGLGDSSEAVFRADQGKYYLVYDSNVEGSDELAAKLAARISAETGLTVVASDDFVTYPNEILLGRVDRPECSAVAGYLSGENDYIAGVFDGTYCIQFSSTLGMTIGASHLIEAIRGGATVTNSRNVNGNSKNHPQNTLLAEAASMAREINGTYRSWVEKALHSNSSAKNDQALIDALVERMGNSVAISVGSSSALYRGYVVKLDPKDYSRATKITEQGHLLIPSAFASEYFGVDLPADANGYVDVTAYCASTSAYSITHLASMGLAVITPADVPSFSNLSSVVGGYQNAAYLARMNGFFNNPEMPEPNLNVEQTRVVLDHVDFDTAYIVDYTKFQYQTFYSPAITSTVENGVTILYAAHEDTTMLNHAEIATVTYIKRSADLGKTWEKVGEVIELRWASLFAWQGKIYLMGDDRGKGTAVIACYDPATGQTLRRDLGVKMGGGAPNVVGFANGRIYKAYNNGVLSAADDADLLSGSSWSASNTPQSLLNGTTYYEIVGKSSGGSFRMEEGNVIVTPSGELYVMYRIDASTIGYVAFFRLSADGKTLSVVEECRSVVTFPYTQSKFSVRYDAVTGLYLSLTSLGTAKNVITSQRNVLGLVASKDLIHWEVIEVLLVDREMLNFTQSHRSHGFQYVDFVMVDEMLYFVVREAVGDTITYHDAKDLTFYTLENYAEVIRNSGKFSD